MPFSFPLGIVMGDKSREQSAFRRPVLDCASIPVRALLAHIYLTFCEIVQALNVFVSMSLLFIAELVNLRAFSGAVSLERLSRALRSKSTDQSAFLVLITVQIVTLTC